MVSLLKLLGDEKVNQKSAIEIETAMASKTRGFFDGGCWKIER